MRGWHRSGTRWQPSRRRCGRRRARARSARARRETPTATVAVGEGYFDPPTVPLDADGQGVPYATYGFAAQIAEVEVDLELGTVKVLSIHAAHDVGRAINPTQVEGQIHGGIAQGLGMALMEEYLNGKTDNLHDYLIPTVGDVPPITVHLIEDAGAARTVRREGRRRAGADSDRAGDPERDPRTRPACACACAGYARRVRAAILAAGQMSGESDERLVRTALRRPAESSSTHSARARERWPPTRCAANACPVLCQISRGQHRRVRPLGQLRRRADARRPGGSRRPARHRPAFPGRRHGTAPGTARSSPPAATTRRCSSPASARARPIRTTSRRPSSSPRSTKASTWSPS